MLRHSASMPLPWQHEDREAMPLEPFECAVGAPMSVGTAAVAAGFAVGFLRVLGRKRSAKCLPRDVSVLEAEPICSERCGSRSCSRCLAPDFRLVRTQDASRRWRTQPSGSSRVV